MLENTVTLVAIHGGGGGYAGYYQSAGVMVVADGTAAGAARLDATLTGDTGIGVLRYADAGYEEAARTARASGLRSLQPEVMDVRGAAAGEPSQKSPESFRVGNSGTRTTADEPSRKNPE